MQRISEQGPKGNALGELQNLMRDIQQVDRNLSFESVPQKVILLLGETKAGKTTLMYYLLGKKLIRFWNDQIGLYSMKPEAKIFQALIGNNYDSTTVYPNIPTELGQDKVLIIDMPGFSDTRNSYRLLNIYIIREVLKKISSVHVSLVIPNETLLASELIGIMERNCLLLNSQLVATQKCISFILTKIEDPEGDLNTFKEALEELKNDSSQDTLSQALTVFSTANIYLFENKQPNVNEGEALKARIIKENRFFQTDQRAQNLLSQSYADIISGEENAEGFSQFIKQVLENISSTFSLLLSLFSAAVKLHHLAEFQLLQAYPELKEEDLKQEICSLVQQLGISKAEISNSLQSGNDEQMAVKLLNLVKKFYVPHKDQMSLEQSQILVELEKLREWSALLAKEESCLGSNFRREMQQIFAFYSKVCKTIAHIKQLEIINLFDSFSSSPNILEAIQGYQHISKGCDLILKVAESDHAARQLTLQEEFMDILRDVKPDFAFSGDIEEVIENKKVSKMSKIKHRKMLESLQTTKQIHQPKKKKAATTEAVINEISKENIQIIRNLPLDSAHLKTLFSCAHRYRSELQNTNNPLKVQFGMVLFRQAAKMLQRVQLYEQAIMFLLAIPAENEAAQLIQVAMDYCGISEEFIKGILLVYYSIWSPNFSMVESLYNYLSLRIYDQELLLQNENQLAMKLEQMHKIDYQHLPLLQRFQYGLIEFIVKEDKPYHSQLIQLARKYEDRLDKSKVVALEKDLSSMRMGN